MSERNVTLTIAQMIVLFVFFKDNDEEVSLKF